MRPKRLFTEDSESLSAPRKLTKLGPRSIAMLGSAGITTDAELDERGAVASFLAVRAAGQPASLNLLWALEAAILDCDWREVARDHRSRLLAELEQTTAQQEKTS